MYLSIYFAFFRGFILRSVKHVSSDIFKSKEGIIGRDFLFSLAIASKAFSLTMLNSHVAQDSLMNGLCPYHKIFMDELCSSYGAYLDAQSRVSKLSN